MELEESQLITAAKDAVERARAYAKQEGDLGDPTRGVQNLTEDEREGMRRAQNCITSSDEELLEDAKRVLRRVFGEIEVTPAEGKPRFLNIAGPYGVNEALKLELEAGGEKIAEEVRRLYKDTKASSHTFTLGDFFRKIQPYDGQRHDKTFPLVRGQASGIMEAAKKLAAEIGIGIIGNDALDFGTDGLGKFGEYVKGHSETHNFAVVAYALTPDQAWQKAQALGDSRFTEETVKASAEKFAASIINVLSAVPTIILLDKDGKVIVHKSEEKGIESKQGYHDWLAACRPTGQAGKPADGRALEGDTKTP